MWNLSKHARLSFFDFNRRLLTAVFLVFSISAMLIVGTALMSVSAYADNQSQHKAKDMEVSDSKDTAIICLNGGINALQAANADGSLGSFSLKESLMNLSINNDIVNQVKNSDDFTLDYKLIEDGKKQKDSSDIQKNEVITVYADNVDAFCQKVSQLDFVNWAKPDQTIKSKEENKNKSDLLQKEINSVSKESVLGECNKSNASSIGDTKSNASNYFNDPLVNYQWDIDKNTPAYSNVNTDAEICKAAENNCWPDDCPGSDPIVAVVDSGVDDSNPDLKDAMWSDGLNIPALKKFNGNEHGVNFNPTNVLNSDMELGSKLIEETSSDTNDYFGHGTHCAGIVAATNNNGIGVGSISSNKTKIMVCKVSGGENTISISGVIKAFSYIKTAKQNNVNVVCASNSWGGGDWLFSTNFDVFKSLVYDLALNGVSVCFASGNNGDNLDNHPNEAYVKYPYAINVGSVQPNGGMSFFSNFGKHLLDVFAPGSNILSTINSNGCYMGYLKQSFPHDSDKSLIFNEDFDNSVKSEFSVSANYKDENSWQINCLTYEDGKAKINFNEVSDNNNSFLRVRVPYDESLDSWLDYDKGFLANFGFEIFDSSNLLAQKSVEVYALIDNNIYDDNLLDGPTSLGSDEYDYMALYANYYLRNQLKTECLNKGYFDLVFVFKFNSKANNYIYLDNLSFSTQNTNYAMVNGTSMACPLVSGLVSNISLFHKSENINDVVSILNCVKGGVQKSSLLENVCLSGGTISSYNSWCAVNYLNNPKSNMSMLEYVNPVINDIKQNKIKETELILSGEFFGEDIGNVYVDNNLIDLNNILEWTDKEIKLDISDLDKNNRLAEVCVERPLSTYGNKGRNYVSLTFNSNLSYLPLSLDFSQEHYTAIQNASYSLKDATPIETKATDKYLYQTWYSNVENSIFLTRYSFDEDVWDEIDLSSLDVISEDTISSNSVVYMKLFSIEAGTDELYFLYPKSFDNGDLNFALHLAVYDEKLNSFVHDSNVDTTACWGDRLCMIDNELTFIGLDGYSRVFCVLDDQLLKNKRQQDIVKVFPDTGRPYNGYLEDIEGLWSGGNVSVYNNQIWLTDGYASIDLTSGVIPEYSISPDYMINNGTVLHLDNTELRTDDRYVDIDQHYIKASYITDKGLLSIGQVKNNGVDSFVDSYLCDYSNLGNGDASIKPLGINFSDFKLSALSLTCHNNVLYVIGADGRTNQNMFKSLDLTKLGLTAQNNKTNSIKDDGRKVWAIETSYYDYDPELAGDAVSDNNDNKIGSTIDNSSTTNPIEDKDNPQIPKTSTFSEGDSASWISAVSNSYNSDLSAAKTYDLLNLNNAIVVLVSIIIVSFGIYLFLHLIKTKCS